MVRPLAVLISDLHFNISNLDIASAALRTAIDKARALEIPLIIAGDLHDTKDIIRATVMNRISDIIHEGAETVAINIIPGNHDRINEKTEEHGLGYLACCANVFSSPCETWLGDERVFLIPYQNDSNKVKTIIKELSSSAKIVIMHQGVQGAFMGDYIQDNSSINPKELEGYKVFSGHYHKHQTVGPVTYIGSPFTHTFGEANDGPKGYLVIYSNGNYVHHALNLRRHIIIDAIMDSSHGMIKVNIPLTPYESANDLVWIKLRGTKSQLDLVDRSFFNKIVCASLKLDKIPYEDNKIESSKPILTNEELLDTLIEGLEEKSSKKIVLKKLWKELLK